MRSKQAVAFAVAALAAFLAWPALGAGRSSAFRDGEDQPSGLLAARRVPRIRGVKEGPVRDVRKEMEGRARERDSERDRFDRHDRFRRDKRFDRERSKSHRSHSFLFRFPRTHSSFFLYPDRSHRFEQRSHVYYPRPSTRYVVAPYVYRPSQAYRNYVILDTPTAHREPPRPEAEAAYESVLSPMLGGPERVGAAYALGEARLAAGEFDEALAAFQEAFARNDAPRARIAVALALLGMERYEGAAHMLRRAVRSVKDWDAVEPALAAAFGSEDAYEAVAARLREAAEGDATDRDVELLLGFHHFGIGRYAQAAGVLYELHERDPADEAVAALLAAAESRLGTGSEENSRGQEGEED